MKILDKWNSLSKNLKLVILRLSYLTVNNTKKAPQNHRCFVLHNELII